MDCNMAGMDAVTIFDDMFKPGAHWTEGDGVQELGEFAPGIDDAFDRFLEVVPDPVLTGSPVSPDGDGSDASTRLLGSGGTDEIEVDAEHPAEIQNVILAATADVPLLTTATRRRLFVIGEKRDLGFLRACHRFDAPTRTPHGNIRSEYVRPPTPGSGNVATAWSRPRPEVPKIVLPHAARPPLPPPAPAKKRGRKAPQKWTVRRAFAKERMPKRQIAKAKAIERTRRIFVVSRRALVRMEIPVLEKGVFAWSSAASRAYAMG